MAVRDVKAGVRTAPPNLHPIPNRPAMPSFPLHRNFLFALALPCLSASALADSIATPQPIGQSANPTPSQEKPLIRSHGHDVRTATDSTGAPAPAGSNGAGSGK